MKQSIINWKELQSINRPIRVVPEENKENMWDKIADFYNSMASLEKEYTLNQINAIPVLATDTLLDMGCGPGRIAIPMAQRVKKVTAVDSAKNMLELCKKNAEYTHLMNLETKLLDFNEMKAEETIEKHDVVVCSRSAGLGDVEKLSTFANRIVAVIIWANAPSIPELMEKIFKDTSI